ncbi:MAG: ankyrin repeat domain-containing protein [Desulfobacterales bacterium]
MSVAEILIKYGADVNFRTKGNTALMIAAGKNQMAMAELLLAHKAAVNAVNEMGESPLMLAAAETGNTALIHLLLKNGADIHTEDKNGQTALVRAVSQCHSDQIVRILF